MLNNEYNHYVSGSLSRRERNMADKSRRILSAAADLFDEHGYAGVTTQQIADSADVAAGTVFRYADTKAELLLAVFNARIEAAIDEGARAAGPLADALDAVAALLTPLVRLAARAPRDTAIYQRELMFGENEAGRYRLDGLRVIDDLETRIAAIIAPQAGRDAARIAARSIFAATHIFLVQPGLGLDRDADELRAQIAQIIAGAQAQAHASAANPPRRHESAHNGGTPPERGDND